MANTMSAGRNAGRRRTLRLPVHRAGSLSGRQPRPIELLDLSPSGCLVRCDALLDAGRILDLELQLDDPLRAKVRVTNACQDGSVAAGQAARFLAGLEFLGLSAREQAALRRFLEDERRRRRSADAAAR